MSVFLQWAAVWCMVFGLGAWFGWGLTYAWHLDQKTKDLKEVTKRLKKEREQRFPYLDSRAGL